MPGRFNVLIKHKPKIKIPRGRSHKHKRHKRTNRDKRRKNKNNIIRGKEVTVREAASDWQVVYGQMRIGGVTTFVNTSSDSHAYLVTGIGNRQIAWIARTGGVTGNDITITLVLSGTASLSVTVTGTNISVRLKSSSGSSQSTADDVIAKIRATPAADALVDVNRGDGNGTDQMQAFPQTALSGGGGTWLHQMITLSGHEMNAVQELRLDERLVTFGAASDPRWGTGIWADKVFMAFQPGTDSQSAQPDLMAQLPSLWTVAHQQRGCAGVYLILVWNQNLFAEGLPEINFLVQGKKCYDPRTLTSGYTQNSALVLGDFLTNDRYGLGIPLGKIDNDTWIEAANRCEDLIPLATGGNVYRYLTNGVFDTGDSREEILNQLLAAMGGDLVWQGGKYYIYAGTYRSPTITLTEDDLRGPIKIRTHVSRSDSFNSIRGTFVDPQSSYHETDAPPITNATYVAQDGAYRWEDLALNFVTSANQAQRLMKIALEQNRQGITIDFPAKLTAFNVLVGENIYLTLAQFGFSAKVFEVIKCDDVIEDGVAAGFDFVLQETASGVYDWNSGEETTVDLAPNTNLPSAYDVDEPSNVLLESGTAQLYVRDDGTVQTRLKVSWTESATEFVFFGGTYEIQYKQSAAANWSQSFTVPGYVNFHHILDVNDGVAYDVQIRAVNTLNYASDWVTVINHTVIGKTAPPSDVTGFVGAINDDGIHLTWNDVADTDKAEYEIRSGANWDSAATVARLRSSLGTAYLYTYRTAGPVNLLIKAIDTSGNYSVNAASFSTTLSGANPINNFTTKVMDRSVLLDWTEPNPSTFSVHEYDVYKGDTFASSQKIGTVFGTFHTYIERLGGTFTYWIVAIDVGGNRSTQVSQTATVAAPANSFIQSQLNPLTYLDYAIGCVIGGSASAPDEDHSSVWLPVPGMNNLGADWGPRSLWLMLNEQSQSITWQQWYERFGFSTTQDLINEGFTQVLQPTGPKNSHMPWLMLTSITGSAGVLRMTLDYGSVLGDAFIDWTWIETVLGSGGVTYETTISTSTDNTNWTDFEHTTQIFASGFRYLKLLLEFEGDSPYALSKLSDMLVTLSLQLVEETGQVSALAADSGGTLVTFTKDFFQMSDIQLTVVGTTFGTPILNFNFATTDPASFRVLVFDENGTRINATVRYRALGALNP